VFRFSFYCLRVLCYSHCIVTSRVCRDVFCTHNNNNNNNNIHNCCFSNLMQTRAVMPKCEKERRGVENEWKRVKDNQKESKQAIPVSKRDRATPHNLPRNLPNPNPNQTTWRRLLHTWVIWLDSFLRSFTRSQAQPPLKSWRGPDVVWVPIPSLFFLRPFSVSRYWPTHVSPGGLKTRDWKTRDGQKCMVWKRGTGKRRTKLQNWKTRKRHVWKAKRCTSHVG